MAAAGSGWVRARPWDSFLVRPPRGGIARGCMQDFRFLHRTRTRGVPNWRSRVMRLIPGKLMENAARDGAMPELAMCSKLGHGASSLTAKPPPLSALAPRPVLD